jgi:hypothetical protein
MAAKSVSAKSTPEAQLRALIENFDTKNQSLIRSVRSAMRKRLPTANEFAYDYGTHVVIAYSPTEKTPDAIFATAARPDGVTLYFTHGLKLPDPKKLLMGKGKQTRFIPLESAARLKHPDVEALMVAAIGVANVPLAAKGSGTLFIRPTAASKRPRPKGKK